VDFTICVVVTGFPPKDGSSSIDGIKACCVSVVTIVLASE
jgi:hypothetical protein